MELFDTSRYSVFYEFMQIPFPEWDLHKLKEQKLETIKTLCKIMGFKSSGNKEELLERLRVYQMAWKVSGLDLDFLQQQPMKFLKFAAKIMGVWGGKNKYSAAASIKSWKRKCQGRGMDYIKNMRKSND